jgi:hypothetical protein
MLVSSDQQIDGQDHILEKKIKVRVSQLDFVFSAFSFYTKLSCMGFKGHANTINLLILLLEPFSQFAFFSISLRN